jgi:hypothetical protein
VDADGGNRIRLLDGCGETVAWSANGAKVYCAGPDGSLQSNSADGGQPIRLASTDCELVWPSPDGNRVICQGDSEVAILDSSGQKVGTLDVNVRPARVAWSPTGQHLVYQAANVGPDFRIADADGRVVAALEGARGIPDEFGWTLDGTRVAYPTDTGVVVLDVRTGDSRTIPIIDSSSQTWWFGGGEAITWVLDDTALLVYDMNARQPLLIDLAIGAVNGLGAANVPWPAPDGVHAAVAWPDNNRVVVLADLEAGTHSLINGSEYAYGDDGMVAIAPVVFSGDSRRVCWYKDMMSTRAGEPVQCADRPDYRTFEGAPLPPTITKPPAGLYDASRWRVFSPDLMYVVTIDATLRLSVVPMDQSPAVELSTALTPYAFAWRPDGVLHPAHRVASLQ